MQQLNGESVLCVALINLEYPQPSYIFFSRKISEFHAFYIVYIRGKFSGIFFSAASRVNAMMPTILIKQIC